MIATAGRALADDHGVLERPFVVVTGKGGVGKTTIATALALHRDGALLCGLDEPSAPGPVERLGIEPDRALGEWLARHAGGPAAALLRRSRAFTYFIAAAPGAAELVTIGKAVDLARQRGAVIFDAPATGHTLAMLAAPRTFAGVSPLGPVAREATAVHAWLADPATTAYVGVTAPEAMAVAELDSLERGLLDLFGRGLDLAVVNGLLPAWFSDSDAGRLERFAGRGPVDAVLVEHRCARREAALAERARAVTDAPVVTVPFAFPRPRAARARRPA